jgi:hypothetical protein
MKAISCLVALSGSLISASWASAQAWTPDKGQGAVSVAVQELNVKKHLSGTRAVDAGHINTVVVLTDVTYGLTDKVALDLALPIVTSTYAGARPHPNTTIDNGKFHGTVTDLRFAVRYNLYRGDAVITPYIGSIVPSHDYAYYGHAAAGQRLREVQVGAFAAKLFTSVPGLFMSGRVAYGFVEKVQDISHNKSLGDFEVGYFLTQALRAFAMASGQYTHGGIDFPLGGLPAVPLKYRATHDIVQQVNHLNTGVGVAYSVTDAMDVFASFSRQVAGRNGHLLNRGITLGASWSFTARGRRSDGAVTAAPLAESDAVAARREGSLGRCTCQKSGL